MQVPNKMLYGCTNPMYTVDLSDTNLALDPVPVTQIYQLCFRPVRVQCGLHRAVRRVW